MIIQYKKPKIKLKKIKIKFMTFDRIEESYGFPGDFGSPIYLASGCFPSGTQIKTLNDGYLNIDKINKNDLILSYDIESKSFIANKVNKIFIHHDYTEGFIIINGLIKVTPNHRLFINNNWIRADEVKINDNIFDANSRSILVNKLEYIKKTCNVYNIQMTKKPYNYFAYNILVHNGPAENKKV